MALNIRLLIALLIALLLTILPLPNLVEGARPPWVLMFVLYLQFYLPTYFSRILLLILGLCTDVLLSTVLGEHAFALLLTTWFADGKARRFGFFSMGQQMLVVALFCILYQLIIYLIDAFLGHHNVIWFIPIIGIMSLFFWPWIRVLADSTLASNKYNSYNNYLHPKLKSW